MATARGNATGPIHMVDLLRTTGAAVRGLVLPAFMDDALRIVGTIRQGWMAGPIAPDKKLPHTAARDTGAAAARLRLDAGLPMRSHRVSSICSALRRRAWRT